jgi:TPR repeat protein
MNHTIRPWLVAVLLVGSLALSPAHAGMTPEEVKTFEAEKKQAEQGSTLAQHNLGKRYYFGEGVEKDFSRAAYWWQKAALDGLATSQFNLGSCYYEGEGVPINLSKATFWWRLSAERDFPLAQTALGSCYLIGDGVTRDPEKAKFWLRKASEQGNATAQFLLAGCYDGTHGIGEAMIKDVAEAYAFYSIASSDHEEARIKLTMIVKQMSTAQIAAGIKRKEAIEAKIAAKNTGK